MSTLFGGHLRKRWTGSRALVVIDPSRCPSCGAVTDTETTTELPLLRHGGYGANRETTRRHCRCGWSLLAGVVETNPRCLP